MKESLSNAREELKRADHLIYVSLKYTRTVDVIKSVIDRLISSFDCVIDGLVDKAADDGKISEVPSAPMAKVEVLRNTIYPEDKQMEDYLLFYLTLRKLSKAEFERRMEFRRHVTMICTIDGECMEIKIDHVTEFYHKTQAFVDFVEKGVE